MVVLDGDFARLLVPEPGFPLGDFDLELCRFADGVRLRFPEDGGRVASDGVVETGCPAAPVDASNVSTFCPSSFCSFGS